LDAGTLQLKAKAMLKEIATRLGLRKKTFFEKAMGKKHYLLYTVLAVGAAFGMRKAAPFVSDFIAKRY
jgi:hypothetical protein